MAHVRGYFYPAHFYIQVLPDLLLGKDRLHVLLVSKDGVGDFADGPLDTGREGLSVHVQTGSLAYPEDELRRQAARLKDLLAVVFADLGDLDEALALLREVRSDHPDAAAVLITDEYALFEAPEKLRLVIGRAFVDGVVVTGLAGKIPMRKTLEHIFRIWKP